MTSGIEPNNQDDAAVKAVKAHHALLAATLAQHVQAVVAAASAADPAATGAARADLLRWADTELLPHARAEEHALYPAAHATEPGRLLVDAMLREHQLITGLIADLRGAQSPTEAAADARAMQVVFGSHLEKENEQILALLTATPGVSVAGLLAGMHELLGAHTGSADATVDEHH